MKNFAAVTQLVIRRNRLVTEGENRNLRAREKLSKQRESAYSSFKAELAREKEKTNNPFTGGGLLGALGTGAIGTGLLNKIRGGRGGPGVRPGRGGRPGPGGGRVKPGNKIVPGPRAKIPGGGGLRGGLRMGRFNAVATTALTGVDYGMRLSEGQTQTQAVSGALSTTAGGLAGMAAGAKGGALLGGSIGAFFGGVGAVPGAAIGGVLGGLIGSFTGANLGAGISDKLTGVGQSADLRRQLEIQKSKLSETTKMRGSNDDYDEAVTKLESLVIGGEDGNGGGIPNFLNADDEGDPPPTGLGRGGTNGPNAPSFQEQLDKIKRKAIPAEVGDFVPDLRSKFVESGGQRQAVDTPYGRLIMSPRTGIFDPNKSIPKMRFISNEETALRREYTQRTLDNPVIGGFLIGQDILNKVPIAKIGGGRVRGSVQTKQPPKLTAPPRTSPRTVPPVTSRTTAGQSIYDRIFGPGRRIPKVMSPEKPPKTAPAPTGEQVLMDRLQSTPQQSSKFSNFFQYLKGRNQAKQDAKADMTTQSFLDNIIKPTQKNFVRDKTQAAQQSGSGLAELFANFKNPLPKIGKGSGIDLNGLAPLFLLPLLDIAKPQEQMSQATPEQPKEEPSGSVMPGGNNKYGIDVFSYLDIIK